MPKIRKESLFMRLKNNIYLMYAIALLQGMVFYAPIATLYRQANGLSIFQITLIETISYLLCILLEMPWGVVADKIGYKKTMTFCCMLFFLSKLVFWKSTSFAGFLLERIMLSVVIAGLSGVDTSILYLSCGDGQSQKIFSIYNSLGVIGMMIASLIFSLFVGDNYYLAAFLTVISYGLAAIISLLLEEVKQERNDYDLVGFKNIFLQIIQNKKLIVFLIAVAFITQTHQTIAVFLNQIQYIKCGLSASTIGYVYILITLAGLLGVFSAHITNKVGVRKIGSIFYFTAITTCIILGFTSNAILSIICILALEIVNSLFQPYQLELQNQHISTNNRATELSIYAMIIDGISAITSLLFGGLAKLSLEYAFNFGGLICFIGLLLFSTSIIIQKG